MLNSSNPVTMSGPPHFVDLHVNPGKCVFTTIESMTRLFECLFITCEQYVMACVTLQVNPYQFKCLMEMKRYCEVQLLLP